MNSNYNSIWKECGMMREKRRDGSVWCLSCKKKHLTSRPSSDALPGEWSRNASAEKDAFAKDVLQPMKKDGTINKQFVEAHGTKSLEKELKVSKQDIHNHIEKYG